jgi:hypothetical protein
MMLVAKVYGVLHELCVEGIVDCAHLAKILPRLRRLLDPFDRFVGRVALATEVGPVSNYGIVTYCGGCVKIRRLTLTYELGPKLLILSYDTFKLFVPRALMTIILFKDVMLTLSENLGFWVTGMRMAHRHIVKLFVTFEVSFAHRELIFWQNFGLRKYLDNGPVIMLQILPAEYSFLGLNHILINRGTRRRELLRQIQILGISGEEVDILNFVNPPQFFQRLNIIGLHNKMEGVHRVRPTQHIEVKKFHIIFDYAFPFHIFTFGDVLDVGEELLHAHLFGAVQLGDQSLVWVSIGNTAGKIHLLDSGVKR